MLLPGEVTPLRIACCCAFSHNLVEALQESLAFGHTLACDYSNDDQRPCFSTEYCLMAPLLFVFYTQISCALNMSK